MTIYDEAVTKMSRLLKERKICWYSRKAHEQCYATLKEHLVNNPVPVSLLSGDRKPQIRFLGNHHSGSGNLYHKSFRM